VGWLAFCGLIAVILATALAVWRKWITPWKDVEELTDAIVSHRAPRKFLISGNPHAQRIGLALENLTNRRRELDERVRESEQSVQAVFGAMLDGLVVVDDLRRVRLMNREFRRMFGQEQAAPGEPLLEVIHHASVDRLVMEAIRAREPRRESIRMSRGGSEGRAMEVSAVPLVENSAQMGGAVILFRDVTQLQQVEEMRREFVANVSHELRTPLSIFRGYLETLLDDPHQPPGELLRILEIMVRHSDRLNALVEDVLSLARLEAPGAAELDLSEISLPEFFQEIRRDWEKRLEAKQLELRLDASPDLPKLEADENRLQEIIYNLLDNAVKYSQAGGAITLRAAAEDARVRMSVSDEGIGISASDLPRIFERFYRADKGRSRELGGTGLGLSIVKHIAQLHGGTVEAESEPGKGTTIRVNLPLSRGH
jgi:two-component system, OmpR family, phosphate regulon sensor histidine kinase PhoR